MFFDISYALTEARPKRGIDCQYPITVSIAFLFRCHWWVIASRFASALIRKNNEFWFENNRVKFKKMNYSPLELFIFSGVRFVKSNSRLTMERRTSIIYTSPPQKEVRVYVFTKWIRKAYVSMLAWNSFRRGVAELISRPIYSLVSRRTIYFSVTS